MSLGSFVGAYFCSRMAFLYVRDPDVSETCPWYEISQPCQPTVFKPSAAVAALPLFGSYKCQLLIAIIRNLNQQYVENLMVCRLIRVYCRSTDVILTGYLFAGYRIPWPMHVRACSRAQYRMQYAEILHNFSQISYLFVTFSCILWRL